MKRLAFWLIPALLVYLATGLYVVVGNEKAVICRMGRVVKTAAGQVVLKPSGLHWDLPWPWSSIDRLKPGESQVIRLPALVDSPADSDRSTASDRTGDLLDQLLSRGNAGTRGQFLTGDRNIVEVEVAIQYRVSESAVEDYLYRHQHRERHLAGLVESVLAETIAASGVDYVHPLGLSELQQSLLQRTARLAEQQRLGITIESISIESVSPPARVKADFLDVADARNDREKFINAARSYASQKHESSRAAARQAMDAAWGEAEETLQQARAAARTFDTMMAQLQQDSRIPRDMTRQLVLERLYLESLASILANVSGQVVLDSGQTIDLTILRANGDRSRQDDNDLQDDSIDEQR